MYTQSFRSRQTLYVKYFVQNSCPCFLATYVANQIARSWPKNNQWNRPVNQYLLPHEKPVNYFVSKMYWSSFLHQSEQFLLNLKLQLPPTKVSKFSLTDSFLTAT